MIPNLTEILPTTASPNAERSVETGSRQGDRNEWRSTFEKAAAAGDLRKPDKPGKTGPAGSGKRTPVSESGSEEKIAPEGKEPDGLQLSLDTQPVEEPVSEETPNPIEIAPEALPTPTVDPPVSAAPEMKASVEVPVDSPNPAPVKPAIGEAQAESIETAPAKPAENPAPAPEVKPVERAPAPPVSAQEAETPDRVVEPANRPVESEPKLQEMPSVQEQAPVNTGLPGDSQAGDEPADLSAVVKPSPATGVITPEPPVQPEQPVQPELPTQPEPPVQAEQPVQVEQPMVPAQPERPVVRRPDGNRGNHGRTARTGPPEHARKQDPKTGNRPEVPPGMLRAMQQKASDALHRVSTALNTKHPAAPLQEPAVPATPEQAPVEPELREPSFPELPQDRPVPIEALRGVRDLPIRKFVAGPKPAQAPLTEFQTLHATSRTAQTAAAGAKQPAVPIHYASLAEAIVARTQALSRNGTARLRFALEPNGLGLVKVKIDSRGQAVRVEIAASTSQAVDTLNQGANRLSQQLQDAGFKDAQVQLTLDTATDSGTQAKHSQHAQQQAAAGRRGSSYHRSREAARAARQYPVIPTSGRLDFVA